MSTCILGVDIGIKTFSVCKIIYDDEYPRILHISTHDLLPNRKCSSLPLNICHRLMNEAMSTIFTKEVLELVDCIHIEQMPYKARKVLWLFSQLVYYECSKLKPTHLINGKKKYKHPLFSEIFQEFDLSCYYQRKKAASKVLERFWPQFQEFKKNNSNKTQKTDDVADAFLIAMSKVK